MFCCRPVHVACWKSYCKKQLHLFREVPQTYSHRLHRKYQKESASTEESDEPGGSRSDTHVQRSVLPSVQKMTGKTITGYLEEYRADKSLPLVQSGQYSMTQIAEMVGFSNPSRFASAFRKRFGCNPKIYNNTRKD